jgi:hypothetical protein
MTNTVIEFVSRQCKTDQHLCGHKNGWTLDQVERPRANATGSSFQEEAQNDYR